jgi:hypothetical protein
MRALRRMGEQIHNTKYADGMKAGGGIITPMCPLVRFGHNQYGEHHLCNRTYPQPCTALTYGIQNEYTFELDLRRKFGCVVFALDPTVNHKALLADGVYFLKWGAPAPAGIEFVGSQRDWIFMPPPLLASLVARHTRLIPVLKMDCEGYARNPSSPRLHRSSSLYPPYPPASPHPHHLPRTRARARKVRVQALSRRHGARPHVLHASRPVCR